jgi:hypothetical protein
MKIAEQIILHEALTVDTTPYSRSHGKEPRGYGQWAFSYGSEDGEKFYSTPKSYQDALRDARVLAVTRKQSIIYVHP